MIIASAAAAAAAFAYARRGAPTQAELDALREELQTSQQKAEKVQSDVAGHFEQSAVLFGRLAHDYRAFLEHFSESARELGISDSMARELLERADQPLLGSDSDVVDTQQRKNETPAEAENSSSSADMLAEAQLPSEDTRDEPATAKTMNEIAKDQENSAESEAAGEAQSDAEPPLIEDVVGGQDTKSVAAAASPEVDLATGVVVDVELKSGEQQEDATSSAEDSEPEESEESSEDTRRHG